MKRRPDILVPAVILVFTVAMAACGQKGSGSIKGTTPIAELIAAGKSPWPWAP